MAAMFGSFGGIVSAVGRLVFGESRREEQDARSEPAAAQNIRGGDEHDRSSEGEYARVLAEYFDEDVENIEIDEQAQNADVEDAQVIAQYFDQRAENIVGESARVRHADNGEHVRNVEGERGQNNAEDAPRLFAGGYNENDLWDAANRNHSAANQSQDVANRSQRAANQSHDVANLNQRAANSSVGCAESMSSPSGGRSCSHSHASASSSSPVSSSSSSSSSSHPPGTCGGPKCRSKRRRSSIGGRRKRQALSEGLQSEFGCPVCFELLVHPFEGFGCGHMLCAQCLLDMVEYAAPAPDRVVFDLRLSDEDFADSVKMPRCPSCRKVLTSLPRAAINAVKNTIALVARTSLSAEEKAEYDERVAEATESDFRNRFAEILQPKVDYVSEFGFRKRHRKQQAEAAQLQQHAEAARQRQQQEELARRQQQAEAAQRQQQAEAARQRQQQEELARRQQHAEAAQRQQQEAEAARQRQQQEELARRQQQEELARRQQQVEAARRQQQQEEEAVRRQQQQEEAARRQQQEELARRQQQVEAARRQQQQEEAVRRQIQEEVDRRQQQEEAALLLPLQEQAARWQQQDLAAWRRQQELAGLQHEEALLRQQQQQQQAALRQQQEDAARRQQQEEAARRQQQELLQLRQLALERQLQENARQRQGVAGQQPRQEQARREPQQQQQDVRAPPPLPQGQPGARRHQQDVGAPLQGQPGALDRDLDRRVQRVIAGLEVLPQQVRLAPAAAGAGARGDDAAAGNGDGGRPRGVEDRILVDLVDEALEEADAAGAEDNDAHRNDVPVAPAMDRALRESFEKLDGRCPTLEYDRFGRSKCRLCREKIDRGTVRVRLERPAGFWHAMCAVAEHTQYFRTRGQEVPGYGDIRAEDLERLGL